MQANAPNPLHGRANANMLIGDDEVGSGCPDLLPLQVLRPMMQGRFAPTPSASNLVVTQSESRAPVTHTRVRRRAGARFIPG
jgi:hypothetical protein